MLDDETTTKLLGEIRDSTSVYDYITKYDSDFPLISFKHYVELVMEKKAIRKSLMVKRSGMSRTYAYQILSGLKKPSRDKVLRLCFGLELNLDETQKLLNIAGLNPLYPKNKRDSILIFSLCNGYTIYDTESLLESHGEPSLE